VPGPNLCSVRRYCDDESVARVRYRHKRQAGANHLLASGLGIHVDTAANELAVAYSMNDLSLILRVFLRKKSPRGVPEWFPWDIFEFALRLDVIDCEKGEVATVKYYGPA
jgi:hypothetical protein